MAEYYPLLAKAVGSLPNSTPESRRVVYERARKALIGQLRTLHPPIPDEDIERESVDLDRAIERIEGELAAAPGIKPAETPTAPPKPDAEPAAKPVPEAAVAAATPSGSLGPAKPFPPLRTKLPTPKGSAAADKAQTANVAGPPQAPDAAPIESASPTPEPASGLDPAQTPPLLANETRRPKAGDAGPVRPRADGQRPVAPQPAAATGPKRRVWIIPVALGLVVAAIAIAAWKLRDRPDTVARTKPTDQQAQTDGGKIAERVGAPEKTAPAATATDQAPAEKPASPAAPAPQQAAAPADQPGQGPASNPELPVAHRAALLVEAPDEPNKVKTFLGTVVWKLNNVNEGPNDAVSLGVEADVDLPDDKLKAVITFQKNTDVSLPASHTIKVRFSPQAGSYTGDVKQISVPQMRREDSPGGEPLAGVTVPVIANAFLVGLSPGNAETANLELIRGQQWIDVPMMLENGKIAKLTFEKSESGQRDINEAIAAWQKQ